MAASKIYTLAQACQVLGMPEQQVLELIDSRVMAAEFNQGLMSYMITQEHLLEFMKSRKMFAQMQKIVVSRVLLCDRDQQIQFLLRTELERGGKIAVKIATTSKEIELAIEQSLPDVLVMHMAATQRATDNLAGLLRRAREHRPIRLILYHNQPDVVVEGNEDIKRLKEYLKVDAIVSIAAGTRKLLATIEETLGVRRETKRVITNWGSSPATQPPPGATPPPDMLPTQGPARGGTAVRKKQETKAGHTTRKTRPPTVLPPQPPP